MRGEDGGRRDGRLWLAVLVVSAVVVGLTGWHLATGGSAGAQVASTTTLAEASDLPSAASPPSTSPSRTPAPRTARPQQTTRPQRSWPTRPARPGKVVLVKAPERLRVAAVDLSLPIVPTTVDKRGQMALPERPSQVGWYAYGPVPGSTRGTAVLAGHLDSDRYGVGPLASLASLKRGAEIAVQGPGGTTAYEVVAVQRISKRALDPAEVFDRDGPPLLRVITCGGDYDPDRGGYQDNLVVTAKPR